jgi:flagellar P-ring protein precursor FlgI
MRHVRNAVFALFLLLATAILPLVGIAADGPLVRLKDLADVEGVRSNQLVGVGLVIGLQGTGDKATMSLQMVRNLMRQFGVTLNEKAVKSKNVAAVSVTCDLPAFARPGQRVDVTVSALGDAKSLQGGTLLQAPLKAADGDVYAVAQGPVMVGGFSAGGAAATLTKNTTTVGRIPQGAIVERDVETVLGDHSSIALLLRTPDFTTAGRVADAVNAAFGNVAEAEDAGRIRVSLPAKYATSPASFIAKLEKLQVVPDSTARVVVNERTGTVVMGGSVRISPVAVAHGNLTVRVTETPNVVQPNAFSGGQTAVEPRTDVQAHESAGQFVTVPANTTVKDLADALNAIGATPRDVIAILQAVKEAGALHGELVTM